VLRLPWPEKAGGGKKNMQSACERELFACRWLKYAPRA
jgi:hypothetical protein